MVLTANMSIDNTYAKVVEDFIYKFTYIFLRRVLLEILR